MGEKEIQEQMEIKLKLRPASALVAERETRRQVAKVRSQADSLDRAVKSIETAHAHGSSEVSIMTLPDSTVAELRKAGYKVTFQKACGMGDVDTHRIEWKTARKRK